MHIPWVDEELVDGIPPAAGFDLDGVDSDGSESGCTGQDDFPYLPRFRSPPARGVDNALSAAFRFVYLDFDGTFESSIRNGPYRLVLEVSAIDSFVSDPSVEVRTVLARPAECEGGTECPLEYDAGGALVVGQSLVVVSREPLAALGSISAGRLQVTLPRMAGPLVGAYSGSGWGPPFPSEFVVLEAPITPDHLGEGMLGGTVEVSHVTRALFPSPASEHYQSLLYQGDFSPRADDPRLCDRMSFGVTFEAIRVQMD